MSETQKKQNVLLCVLVVIAVIIAAVFFFAKKGDSQEAGTKDLTLIVTHGDGSEKTFEISTSKEVLGEVLLDEKIAEGENGEYGLFITSVDGENADSEKEQWWCVTKKGEEVTTGADQTPVADGEQYELTLKTGY